MNKSITFVSPMQDEVTCNRSEVVQACKNATCSELFTDTVTVSLDPSMFRRWRLKGNSQVLLVVLGPFISENINRAR